MVQAISRVLKTRRVSLGISQRELAVLAGTSHSVIARIEGGHGGTSLKTLERIATALDLHLLVRFEHQTSAD